MQYRILSLDKQEAALLGLAYFARWRERSSLGEPSETERRMST